MIRDPAAIALVALSLLSFSREAALAWDPSAPASVRITVTDSAGKPIPDAVLARTNTSSGAPDALGRTDADGTIKWQSTRPPDETAFCWDEYIAISAARYMPAADYSITAFPNAHVEETIKLEERRTTVIKLRDPAGNPLANVGFVVWYTKNHYQESLYHDDAKQICTDADGEYRWEHGLLPDGFLVSVDENETMWLGPHKKYQDAAEVIVTVPARQMTAIRHVRRIEGRLLLVDGKPAVGWLVGRGTVFTGAGGSIPGPMWNSYWSGGPDRIAADGTFALDVCDANLMIVSPEGIPFLYHIAPANWEEKARPERAQRVEEAHRVDLTVPALRHPIAGQVVDETGKPLADVPILIDGCHSNGEAWQATFGNNIGKALATDLNGRYSLPIYAGGGADFRFWNLDYDAAPGAADRIARQFRPPPDLSNLKDIAVLVKDPDGHVITEIGAREFQGQEGSSDARGIHFFVPRQVDKLDLETRSYRGLWKPMKCTLNLHGADDQSFRIDMGAKDRVPGLRVKILGSDGKPAVGVQVTAFADASAKDRSETAMNARKYEGFDATSNADGELEFAAMPPGMKLRIARSDESPDWSDPVIVPDGAQLTIRLRRGGSIKALLPPGAEGGWITGAPVGPAGDDPLSQLSLSITDDAGVWREQAIPPGRYVLDATHWTGMEDQSHIAVEVTAGKETIIDLRDRKSAVEQAPQSWNTLKVMHDHKPVSGAEVFVYTDRATPDTKTQAAVPGFLNEAKTDEGMPDSLTTLMKDLSDVGGGVRFKAEVGQHCIAVAKVRGQLLGAVSFVADGKTPATLELEPTRTLVAQVDPRDGLIAATISLPQGAIGRAIGRVLCLWGDTSDNVLRDPRLALIADGPGQWCLPDVPVSAAVRLQWDFSTPKGAATAEVRIEPGAGDFVVDLRAHDPK